MRYSLDDKLKALRRELGYRRRVFARRVSEGKMSQVQADHEIAVFEAIENDYEAQRDVARPLSLFGEATP